MILKATFKFNRAEKIKLKHYIIEQVAQEMYERIIANDLQGFVREQIKQRLLNSQEVENLKSNKSEIRYALGVWEEEVIDTVNEIIKRVSDSMFLNVKKYSNGVVLKLSMIQSNYDDLFSIPSAHFISYGKSKADIPWLKWLLSMGDTIIFDDYRVSYIKPPSVDSRTGFAFMVNPGTFRVTAGFSGIETDNFIVRALENIPIFINKYLDGVLKGL